MGEFFELSSLGYDTIKELETNTGILASGRNEVYGCVFGRDSLITAHNLIAAYGISRDQYLMNLARKILLGLASLQGQTVNIESGEEPGKCIHEFRPENHERLTKFASIPWYVYPDNKMRNYDSVDATPLFLIVAHEYFASASDDSFLEAIMPSIHASINWIFEYGDKNRDGFLDYQFNPDRKSGGLKAQSWMDSVESLLLDNIPYPIAPVEVQAYVYAAFVRWGNYFKSKNGKDVGNESGDRLLAAAVRLKNAFNERFVLNDNQQNSFEIAFALDGKGSPIHGARSSIGHIIWAAVENPSIDCILDKALVGKLVERITSPDLFEPLAGIRTLSSLAPNFDPSSYHNGSIWPHDTAMIVEGLANFGYLEEASRVRQALLLAYRHFKTPIELFVFNDGKYLEYKSVTGQEACRKQAWSAAALLKESLRNNPGYSITPPSSSSSSSPSSLSVT